MGAVLDIIIKMSCLGVFVGIVVLPIKYILQKCGMPRKILFLLWAVIGLRLICPTLPDTQVSIFNIAGMFDREAQVEEKHHDTTDVILAPVAVETLAPIRTESEKETDYLPCIYIAGVIVMLTLSIADYVRLKRKLRFAVKKEDDIYISDRINSAFVFGIIKPKIYIPEEINEGEYPYVIAHEKLHIQRKDYIVKILAYIILSMHWFNPFVWIMFKLFSEEMEFVCDECTLLELGNERKSEYIESLLACSSKRKVYFYNVSFSANHVKRRCVNVLRVKPYKKTVSFMAVVICVFLSVTVGTDAKDKLSEKVMPVTEEVTEAVTELNTIDILETFPTEQAEAETAAAVPQAAEVTEIPTEVSVPIIKSGYEEGFNDITSKQMQFDNIDIDSIINVLESQGISSDSGGVLDLKEEFSVRDFSFNTNLEATVENVMCDTNGNISVYFELNTDCFVWVSFFDQATGEKIENRGILANDKNVYSFLGCDKDKSYRVKIESPLGNTWQIEGKYIIY